FGFGDGSIGVLEENAGEPFEPAAAVPDPVGQEVVDPLGVRDSHREVPDAFDTGRRQGQNGNLDAGGVHLGKADGGEVAKAAQNDFIEGRFEAAAGGEGREVGAGVDGVQDMFLDG